MPALATAIVTAPSARSAAAKKACTDFSSPRPCRSITGELPEATSKYGRKYGCRHRAHGREFRVTWSRDSSEQNLISGRSHEIRLFDDNNTEAPHFALVTGAARSTIFSRIRNHIFWSPISR